MKQLMIGNAAVARGLYEAGCGVASSYPGTPSTEITEEAAKYDEIYCEWAPNEKVALEVAFGAAVAGKRSFCGMKHVGLNVAADPLFTISYTGINAGMIIGVAHVSVTTIQKYTVVSAQVAEEMALGTAQASGADISVTTTGYAGPEDGEDGTPAGTVYIGTCFRGCVESRKYCFDGDRGQVRLQAAREAMKFALERMKQIE